MYYIIHKPMLLNNKNDSVLPLTKIHEIDQNIMLKIINFAHDLQILSAAKLTHHTYNLVV